MVVKATINVIVIIGKQVKDRHFLKKETCNKKQDSPVKLTWLANLCTILGNCFKHISLYAKTYNGIRKQTLPI